ncbi:MAG: hypothetical protein JJU20_15080 [Opitutales bacterium]|nr:hypothetical protein [Opitutales bacterium]
MKYCNLKTLKSLLIGACVAPLFASSAFAQTASVVEWGPSSSIVNGPFWGDNDGSSANVLNLSTPYSSFIWGSLEYYDGNPSRIDRSVNFYSSVWTSSDANDADASVRVYAGDEAIPWWPSPIDAIVLHSNADSGVPHDTAAIVLWQKQDGFINGFDLETLAFDDLSIAMSLGYNSAQDGIDFSTNHLVVRQGGSDFYVSNNIGSTLENMTTYTRIEDVGSLATEWFEYDPTSDIAAVGAPASPVLDDITAIGVLNRSEDMPLAGFEFYVAEMLVEAEPQMDRWAGFPIDESNEVNTGNFLGQLYAGLEPWIFSYTANQFFFMPESHVTETGAWLYIPMP